MIFGNSNKQKEILLYVKKKGSVSQPEIIRHFLEPFEYKNDTSGAVAIGQMLKKLESNGFLKSVRDESSNKYLKTNMWSVK